MRAKGGLNCLAEGGTPEPRYGLAIRDDWKQRLYDHYVEPIVSAFTAPHDAMTGQLQTMDPETGMPSQDVIDRARDMTTTTALGAGAIPAEGMELRHGLKIGQKPRMTIDPSMTPEARLARAREQGYTVDAYHGTDQEFPAFDSKRSQMGTHVGSSPQANEFSTFDEGRLLRDDGQSYPVRVKAQNPVRMMEPYDGDWSPLHVWHELKRLGKLDRKYDNPATLTEL